MLALKYRNCKPCGSYRPVAQYLPCGKSTALNLIEILQISIFSWDRLQYTIADVVRRPYERPNSGHQETFC